MDGPQIGDDAKFESGSPLDEAPASGVPLLCSGAGEGDPGLSVDRDRAESFLPSRTLAVAPAAGAAGDPDLFGSSFP